MKKYKECPIFDMTCPNCLASGECLLHYPEDDCDEYKQYYDDPVEEDEDD